MHVLQRNTVQHHAMASQRGFTFFALFVLLVTTEASIAAPESDKEYDAALIAALESSKSQSSMLIAAPESAESEDTTPIVLTKTFYQKGPCRKSNANAKTCVIDDVFSATS